MPSRLNSFIQTSARLAALSASLFFAHAETLDQRKTHIRSLLDEEDYRAAWTEASAAQKQSKDDVEVYRFLGAAALGLGDLAEAEKQIQWMLDLRIGKSDYPGWLLLARFREATGDPEGALEALNFAHARATTAAQRNGALVAAGRLHLQSGRIAVAEQAVSTVLAQDAASRDALELQARIRLAQGRKEDAVELLRSSPGNGYLLATLTQAPADWTAFEKQARSLAARPRNLNFELVSYLATGGQRLAEALELARQEATRRHDARTLAALALALSVNGRQDEAANAMKQALANGSRDPDITGIQAIVQRSHNPSSGPKPPAAVQP